LTAVTAVGLVELAARLHGLCDLCWGVDEHQIAHELDVAAGGSSWTQGGGAEFRRTRDGLVDMWHDHDPLARRATDRRWL
jgi:hypothetical protein